MDSRPPPKILPMMPPALSLKPSGEKCSVANAQLLISVAIKPPKRSAKSARVNFCWAFCARKMIQPK